MASTKIVGVDPIHVHPYFARMTPEQSRAARGWLDWGQQELASAASVSLSTVRDYEKGRRTPIPTTLAAMKAALEAQGIAFVDDGVALGISRAKPADA